jgi:hypothetical protein
MRIEDKQRFEAAIERYETKTRVGCYLCMHLKMKNNKYICTYANRACRKDHDEEEYEFEVWKEAKALHIEQEYFAKPYPCAGCYFAEEAKKAMVELGIAES